jgi:hypothetical protein
MNLIITCERFSIALIITLTSIHSSCTNNGAANGAAGGGNGAGRGLHCIVLGVLKQVDNLRSAVAKNALLTLGDLFQGLGKFMDLEVALSLTHVLKVRAKDVSQIKDVLVCALTPLLCAVPIINIQPLS